MNMELITAITQCVSSLGFPIFVACYMLYKGSKDSEEMRETINDLKTVIVELVAEFKHHNKEDEE